MISVFYCRFRDDLCAVMRGKDERKRTEVIHLLVFLKIVLSCLRITTQQKAYGLKTALDETTKTILPALE